MSFERLRLFGEKSLELYTRLPRKDVQGSICRVSELGLSLLKGDGTWTNSLRQRGAGTRRVIKDGHFRQDGSMGRE